MLRMTTDRHAMGESLRGLALGDGFGARWFWRRNKAVELIGATYTADPYRQYGAGTAELLPRLFADPGRVAEYVPEGVIRSGIDAAARVDPATPSWKAADVLGYGQRICCSDTVPFALWTAAVHLDDYEEALCATAAGLGDVDTTCAIAVGIVAARTGIGAAPRSWLELREPLPAWTDSL